MAQRQHPDVIVLDLMMPVMDGYEALEVLAGDERTAAVPVIVLSARMGERERERCLQAGAFAALAKPFEPEILNEAILEALA
jgi:CheY-like chemotaxis protein